MRTLHLVAAALVVGGCAADPRDINKAPELTSVGAGLSAPRVPAPLAAFPASAPRYPDSLWSTTTRSL